MLSTLETLESWKFTLLVNSLHISFSAVVIDVMDIFMLQVSSGVCRVILNACMASSKILTNDFAPAWLKLPNEEKRVIYTFVLHTLYCNIFVRDVNGTRFSRVPKKFLVPGKEISRSGEFREIAKSIPSLLV